MSSIPGRRYERYELGITAPAVARLLTSPTGTARGRQWANGAATLTGACLPAQPRVGALSFPARSSNDERRTLQRFLALEP